MSSLETRLTILATRYGRHPVYVNEWQVGFAGRDQTPDVVYDSIEEAIKAEAQAIRATMVMEQQEIRSLEYQINVRLTHLGILDD